MIHDEQSFDLHLRHARGHIARNYRVREWSLFAIKLIARKCLYGQPDVRGEHAGLVREAELLLAGVMSHQVDARLFHAGGLVFYLKLMRVSDAAERTTLVARARGMLDAALQAARPPDPELLLDYAMFELDAEQAGDVSKALALVAQASDSPRHRVQVERLRTRLCASLRLTIQRTA